MLWELACRTSRGQVISWSGGQVARWPGGQVVRWSGGYIVSGSDSQVAEPGGQVVRWSGGQEVRKSGILTFRRGRCYRYRGVTHRHINIGGMSVVSGQWNGRPPLTTDLGPL